MKKLLVIFLGLASFNAHANGCPGQFDPVTGICRFQGNNGELIHYNIAPPQSGSSSPPPKKNHLLRREGAFQIRGLGVQSKNWVSYRFAESKFPS